MPKSVLVSTLVPVVGELDICNLCDASPHLRGCPHHPQFENDDCRYASVDAPDDVGSAEYWVIDTFQQAAVDAGASGEETLREAIQEFEAALSRGELKAL